MSLFEFLVEQWALVSMLAAMAFALFLLESKKGGQSLGHFDVTRLLNSGEAKLLDIRESKEFGRGHIVDALNIPHDKLASRSDELEKFRSVTIVIADKMGQHAGSAGKLLSEKGFQTARLQGGMAEWQQQNLPLVK